MSPLSFFYLMDTCHAHHELDVFNGAKITELLPLGVVVNYNICFPCSYTSYLSPSWQDDTTRPCMLCFHAYLAYI